MRDRQVKAKVGQEVAEDILHYATTMQGSLEAKEMLRFESDEFAWRG